MLNRLISYPFSFFSRSAIHTLCFNTYNVFTRTLFPMFWCFETQILITGTNKSKEGISYSFIPNQFWDEKSASGFIDLEVGIEEKERIRFEQNGKGYYFILPGSTDINLVNNQICKVDGPFQALLKVDASTVYFKRFNKEVIIDNKNNRKTILELAEEAGINPEKGCERGLCGTCKMVLHEGEVKGKTVGVAVYCCQSFPSSNRVVLGG